MPVTARLSKSFYDKLGDDVANELVIWLNAVDDTFRGDLRSLNETNFVRFDARLEQRVATSEAKLEQRIAAVEAKLERRFDEVDAKIASLETRMDARFELQDRKLEARSSQFEATIEKRFGEQSRWMFAAWASLLIPIVAFGVR